MRQAYTQLPTPDKNHKFILSSTPFSYAKKYLDDLYFRTLNFRTFDLRTKIKLARTKGLLQYQKGDATYLM